MSQEPPRPDPERVASAPADTRFRRRARTVAAIGLALELTALVILVGVGIYADLRGRVSSGSSGWAVTVFVALIAAAVAAILVAVTRRRRWATAPGITLQLFVLFALVWPALSGGNPLVGGLLGVVALATAIALVVQSASLPAPTI